VLRKCSSREAALYGTNWSLAKTYSTAWNGVHEMNTTSPNAYIEHTFFGTGVEIKYVTHPNRATNIPITINGLAAGTSNFPNVQVTSSGGSHTRSSSSLILNQNTAGLPLTAVTSIKGLPLGVHKVRLTHSGTSGSYLAVTAFDCITPVHVHKDVNYVQGASSVVGSCSVSDIRKTDSSKEKSLAYKNWMEFRQTGNFFTTFAGFWVPTGAGGTIRTRQGFVDVRLSGIAFPRPLNHGMYISVKMDGNFVGHYVEVNPYSSNDEPQTIATSFLVPVSEGVHSFRVHINVSSVGSLSNCVLTVKEI
jgi:hypothetical protein